jgi:hypothetical protein
MTKHDADPSAHRPGAILETVASITAQTLAERGFALRRPVGVRMRSGEDGATGVEVSVSLADPRAADAARASLYERFGGAPAPDLIYVQ